MHRNFPIFPSEVFRKTTYEMRKAPSPQKSGSLAVDLYHDIHNHYARMYVKNTEKLREELSAAKEENERLKAALKVTVKYI